MSVARSIGLTGRRRHPAPRSILITGASGGIGAALALAFAAPGVHLALGGRDQARLEAVTGRCRRQGALAHGASVDVTDRAAMARWALAVDRETPLDLVIANAGTGGPGGQGGPEVARTIFAVNLDGVLNTIQPILPAMTARGQGQLALMSSLAGFRGQPSAPAYCASKAAVLVWGEGLRGRLGRQGIAVSVICPGFVRTPMTAGNPFPTPLVMAPERAAAIIRRGLLRRRARIAFPLPLYWGARLLQALPAGLADRWLARVPDKE
jgi:short-subunit dehydrogenase